jgi:hypothetical protein
MIAASNIQGVQHPAAPIGVSWAEVKLGPKLPMTVFTSTQTWQTERIGALALYCSDGRWGEAFDEFCHRRLLMPRYDRWAVPGGPSWLAGDPDGDGMMQAAREQLDFLVRVHELERIILITHYGCAVYAHRHRRDADNCLPYQLTDVQQARETLRQWFPDIKTEAYLAMRVDNTLTFHALEDH